MNPKLIITIVVVLAAIYAGTQILKPAEPMQKDHSHHGMETATGQGPAIGGTFALVDQKNQPYTDADLKGHYSLVFFGFTHCPDMCPMALSNMTNALDSMLPQAAEKITPIMISVDPKRDTPEVMAAYASNFHPRLVALTGTPEQVNQAAGAFKVYHQVADPDVEDYMVNHSGFIYLMDPAGRYVKHFPHTATPQELAVELEQLVF